jgi:hypothetical protein
MINRRGDSRTGHSGLGNLLTIGGGREQPQYGTNKVSWASPVTLIGLRQMVRGLLAELDELFKAQKDSSCLGS